MTESDSSSDDSGGDSDSDGSSDSSPDDSDGAISDGQPGFGAVVTVGALTILGMLGAFRRR